MVGGTITVAASAVATVATEGAASPITLVAGAHGVNSAANGIRDINHIIDGDYDAVGKENYLRDNVYVPIGKETGYPGFQV